MKRMIKRMRLPTNTLPQELFTQILSKLPSKSLVRFRSLSKLCCSLIDEQYFISTHLTNCQNNLEKSHLLVLEPPNMIDGNQKCTLRRGEKFRKTYSLGLDVTWFEHYQVVGYINGVVCMTKHKEETQFCGIFLWNPSIKKLLELPLPNIAYFVSTEVEVDFAFGFNPVMNDYKVIASLHSVTGIHISEVVDIYTLSKGSWKNSVIEKGPCSWSKFGPKAFLNGVTYWIGNDFMNNGSPKGKYTHFVAFDASNDVFNYIELPNCEDVNAIEHQRFPVILGQSVALMEIFRTHSYIWVMEEFGVTKSWTKRYSVNLQLYHSFLYLKTNGDLLFTGDREGVKSYNIETQETTTLAKSYKLTPTFTDVYIESLVLLNQVHEKPLCNFPIEY